MRSTDTADVTAAGPAISAGPVADPHGTPTTPGARRARSDLERAVALLDLRRGRFVLATLLGSLAMIASVGLSATAAWLIARAAQMPPVLDLTVASVGVRAFGVSRAVLRYAERLVSHDVALRGMASLREQLYSRLADGRLDAVAGLRRGDLLARTGADVDEVGDVVVRAYLPMAVAALVSTVSVVIVAALLPVAGLVLAGCLAVTAIGSSMLAGRAAAAAQEEHLRTGGALSASALTLLDGAGELAVSGRTDDALRRLRGLESRLAAAADRRARPLALTQGLDTAALGAAVLGALLTGLPAVAAGTLDPVALAVVVLTPLASFEGTSQLGAAAAQRVRSAAAAGRIMALLDAAAPEFPEPARPGPHPTTPPPDGPRVLRAEGLAVGRPGGPVVLEGVDLEVRPGRALALVGPSGVGKTTLLLTLAGLLAPKAGSVTLDGVDLADLDHEALAGVVTPTFEDAHVFATTVLENLRVARGDVTPVEARAALDAAGLGAWLAGLPDGLDTMVGASATTISGGERRRLLLARALCGTAALLLVDEPAEHLDPGTADRLVADLLRGRDPQGPDAARTTGTLVATHRLAALDAADEVLILERRGQGPARVRARGTHARLAAHDDAYAWTLAQESGKPGVGTAPEPPDPRPHEEQP